MWKKSSRLLFLAPKTREMVPVFPQLVAPNGVPTGCTKCTKQGIRTNSQTGVVFTLGLLNSHVDCRLFKAEKMWIAEDWKPWHWVILGFWVWGRGWAGNDMVKMKLGFPTQWLQKQNSRPQRRKNAQVEDGLMGRSEAKAGFGWERSGNYSFYMNMTNLALHRHSSWIWFNHLIDSWR